MGDLKIDIHTHVLPKDIPDFQERFGYGGFIKLDHHKPCCARMLRDDGTFFREIQENCWSSQARVADLISTQVSMQVLSTVPVMFSYWAKPQDTLEVARYLNDDIAERVAEHPTRFMGLATIPMQEPKLAIKELERCLRNGFHGVQIGTHINDMNLNHERLFEIFEACAEMGAAVFVHPWDMMGMDRMPEYWLPWLVGMPAESALAISSMIFGGVFERLPQLRVAFAHGGGSFPGTVGRISHGFKVRPDLCAKDNPHPPEKYLGQFFVDSLVHDPNQLKNVIDLLGEDKVLLGSDYPFPLGEKIPGRMIDTSPLFSQSLRQKIYLANPMKWLNLSPDDDCVRWMLNA